MTNKKKNAQPQIGDVVWMACRAASGCEGKQATINLKFDQTRQGGLSLQGRSIRYVCETCKRPFHINY